MSLSSGWISSLEAKIHPARMFSCLPASLSHQAHDNSPSPTDNVLLICRNGTIFSFRWDGQRHIESYWVWRALKVLLRAAMFIAILPIVEAWRCNHLASFHQFRIDGYSRSSLGKNRWPVCWSKPKMMGITNSFPPVIRFARCLLFIVWTYSTPVRNIHL